MTTNPNTIPDISVFAEKIGVQFNNPDTLLQAFVHRSYVNENRDFHLGHNERLEFLGDAVLELIATDYLFSAYPDKAEGELTAIRSAIVNTQSLSGSADILNLNDYLLLSKGEAKDTGRARGYILANTFEAVIGALYVDQGYDAAKTFVENHLLIKVDDIVANKLWLDSKSYFQEKAQEFYNTTPHYEKMSEEGPDHDKVFTMGLFIGRELVARAQGASKQDAEQVAARKGLEVKGWLE